MGVWRPKTPHDLGYITTDVSQLHHKCILEHLVLSKFHEKTKINHILVNLLILPNLSILAVANLQASLLSLMEDILTNTLDTFIMI